MDLRKLLCTALCLLLVSCSSASAGSETLPQTTPETTIEPTAEPTPEPTPTPTPEPKTFLEEQGITITPQGNFDYTAWAEEGKFPMHANCTITEEPAETEGYKKVIATVTYDVTDTTGGMILTREFPFDRYTGLCFDTTNELSLHLEAGETQLIESGQTVVYEGREYQTAYTVDRANNWPQLLVHLTVVCPEDYDGTVFVVRYADEETNEQDTAHDWTQPATIDELPCYGTAEAFYFTASDK